MLNAFRYSLENILNETLRNHTIKAATFSRRMYKRCGADESLVCVSLLNISPNTVTLAQWDYFVLSLIWFYNGEKRGANNRTKNTFFSSPYHFSTLSEQFWVQIEFSFKLKPDEASLSWRCGIEITNWFLLPLPRAFSRVCPHPHSKSFGNIILYLIFLHRCRFHSFFTIAAQIHKGIRSSTLQQVLLLLIDGTRLKFEI